MPQDELDPAANTEMFQAFVDRPEPEESRASRSWVVLAAAAAVVVVLLVLAWILLG
ncbi:hypothetical protein [Nocardioides guangzhouensis]|uniref:hypothetical protein n=1 Tax=Nocardioides guangzhouensis TaxID=2497878 RepID=UPI001438461B|nr:hypothetical protein [Nocardioides guangzhouensis]